MICVLIKNEKQLSVRVKKLTKISRSGYDFRHSTNQSQGYGALIQLGGD